MRTYLILLILPLQLFGIFQWQRGGHHLLLGPEFYHSERKKMGGTRQTAYLYGLRGNWNRFCPWGIYLGAEGAIATGTATGSTGGGAPLHSQMTDYYYEGRLGVTIPWYKWVKGTISLYTSYGAFVGVNDYTSPSPLTLKYRNSFQYSGGGILTRFKVNDCMQIGFHFAVHESFSSRSLVTEDPIFEDSELIMNDQLQYRIEIPIEYKKCICGKSMFVGLTPFARFRHYGGRENFPFDFFDTRYQIYGLGGHLRYIF